MKFNLNRIKNGPRPKILKNAVELQAIFENPLVFEKYGMNLDQTAPLYFDTVISEQFSFCVFQSNIVIEFVKENIEPALRHYLIDGTFDCVPCGFYQLLIISIEYRNDVSLLNSFSVVLFVVSCFCGCLNRLNLLVLSTPQSYSSIILVPSSFNKYLFCVGENMNLYRCG